MSEHDYEGKRVSVESEKKTLGEALGSGAEGAVHAVENEPSAVVKIFEPEKRDEKADKVRAMIDSPPTDPSYQHGDKRSIVWPTAVAEEPNTGEFLGYRMPYKDLSEQKNAQRYARENLQWGSSSPDERYRTALNIARMFDAIHCQKHALGDLNHQNILIDAEAGGFVSLIDCDAFHIKGQGEVYPGETVFPRYTPPEGRGDTLMGVRKSDRFGLGVHIFQLLMEGFHPYQAQGSEAQSGSLGEMIDENDFPYENPKPGELEPHDMAPDYQQLPSEIRDLFSKCFGAGGKTQGWRPTAAQWTKTLEEVTGLSGKVGDDGEDGDGDGDGNVTDLFPDRGADEDGDGGSGTDTGSESGESGSGNDGNGDKDDGDGNEDIEDIFGTSGGGSSTGGNSTTTADDEDDEDEDVKDIFRS